MSALAGVEGIEPPVAVLETAGLPLTDTPMSVKFRTGLLRFCRDRWMSPLSGYACKRAPFLSTHFVGSGSVRLLTDTPLLLKYTIFSM